MRDNVNSAVNVPTSFESKLQDIENDLVRSAKAKRGYQELLTRFGGLSLRQYQELPQDLRKLYRRLHGRPLTADERRAKATKNRKAIKRRRIANKSRAVNYANAKR